MAIPMYDKKVTTLLVIDPYKRFAAELGYQATMVKDATADYPDKEMHAALDVNIPNYASDIMTTKEVVESMSAL